MMQAPNAVDIRTAEAVELDRLAEIWHQGWQDAHARILPAALARYRTRESFRSRLQDALPDVRVGLSAGTPVGLCIIKDDELYQLYVSSAARGRAWRERCWPTPSSGSARLAP